MEGPVMATARGSDTGPLAGLRVVSLAEQYPGPYATLLMADMGAEVILVERPAGGDPARQFPSFHESLNRGKRAVTIDLKDAAGREALRALVRSADVLLEGFRPGTMARLGFGFDDCARLNPALVYVSISGFGQTGPYRDRPAHDLSYQAIAGLMYRHARSGRAEPAGDLAVGDLSSAMFAAVGTLAALHERGRTGRGQHVDVSMTDGLVSWMTVMVGPTMNGEDPADIGAEPAYGTFRCADGRLLTLSVAHEDWFWRPLCQLLDMPDAAGLGHEARVAGAGALRARIADAIGASPRDAWAHRLDAAAIPWGPVNDLHEVAADPHFAARGMFRAVRDADGRDRLHVVQPLVFAGRHPGPLGGVPALGEGNAELLGDKEQ
jgi:crotonobetainyl-CoA:carnitine CoA-transferase CaiB-like acyl-CoA transferase